MELHVIDENFTVCKLEDCSGVDPNTPWCFLSRTDEEISLVCPTGRVPANTLVREDGWRAFRVQGVLDFSLIGILAQISEYWRRAKSASLPSPPTIPTTF